MLPKESNKRQSFYPSDVSKRWIMLLMLITIVVLSYFVFYQPLSIEESEILKFVTYTSSLLSIILSVFAIFYAYLTSMDTSNKLSSMDTTLHEISTLSDNINTTSRDLTHALGDIKERLPTPVTNPENTQTRRLANVAQLLKSNSITDAVLPPKPVAVDEDHES